MRNIAKTVKLAATGFVLAACATVTAAADILIIDQERVQREAAAYKDFDLQTAQIREAIIALRQRTSPDGYWDQTAIQFQQRMKTEFDDLEQKKSIIGDSAYQTQRGEKEQSFQAESQRMQLQLQQETTNLRQYELFLDNLRREALTQVERARGPLLRNILKERGAQIIMRKSLAMETAAGLDVTTEFIEQLDDALPTVTLSLRQQSADEAEEGGENPTGDGSGGQ